MKPTRRTLDPKLDIVFRMLFGDERNRPLLLSLLNAVLRPARAIESVEVLPSDPEKALAGDKDIALDLRVRLEGGEQIDIEMQSQRRPALQERFLYYWARLYAGQLSRGEQYPALRRCAVILFVDFEILAGQRYHSRFQVREQHSQALLTDHLELHVVELPKVGEALDRNDEPELALWSRFLSATTDTEIEVLAKEHPVLKQAKEALETLSEDPSARIQAEMREMALLSYKLDMGKVWRDGLAEGEARGRAEGEARGRAEGEARGRAEGKVETLRKLLTLKFGELPEPVMRRLRSVDEPELDQWLERVLSGATLDDVLTVAHGR